MASLVCSFCIIAIIQAVTCQYLGNSPSAGFNNGLFGANFGNGFTGSGFGGGFGGPNRQSSGGGFAVTSSSPISPTGVSILAENLAIEGPLAVGGQLPFLGSVGLEGTLQASGSGTVSYGCGTGNIGITSDFGGQNGLAGQYGQAANGLGPAQGGYSAGGGSAGFNQGLGGSYGPGMGGPNFGNGFAGSG